MSFRGRYSAPFELVKEGGVGMKSKSGLLKSYKSRWLRLYRETSCHGSCRFELFENMACSLTQIPKEVIMAFQGDRALVIRKGGRCGVHVCLKNHNQLLKLTTASLFEADLWVQLINDCLNWNPYNHNPSHTAPPFRHFSLTTHSVSTPPIFTPSIHSPTKQLSNISFYSSTIKKNDHTSSFMVKILAGHHFPTTTPCLLQLSSADVSFISLTEPSEVMLRWSIEEVRRYGCGKMCFVLEPECADNRLTVYTEESVVIYNTFQQLSNQLYRKKSSA